MSFIPDYELLRCNCGGTIGIYDLLTRYMLGVDRYGCNPICDRCGKEFKLYELHHDYLEINDKTGWVFPVIYRKDTT